MFEPRRAPVAHRSGTERRLEISSGRASAHARDYILLRKTVSAWRSARTRGRGARAEQERGDPEMAAAGGAVSRNRQVGAAELFALYWITHISTILDSFHFIRPDA